MKNNLPKILKINSDISELSRVEVFVKELFREHSIPKRYFNKVLLCVSEGVINSIEHGNQNDDKKKVSIFANCGGEGIVVEIKDEGRGFDMHSIHDPTNEKNIKKESGRGIHIIKSLSEKFEYNKEEKSIQFKINCK